MALSTRTIWIAVIGLSAIPLGTTTWQWSRSLRTERRETQRLERLTRHATTITELGKSLPAWASGPRPAGSLAPEVSATLAGTGLPPSVMNSLSADPDSSAGQGSSGTGAIQARTRRGTLVLTSLTLPQLGAFCAAWRERQPGWTISALDVSPEGGNLAAKTSVASTGGDLPLRAVLTLESISLERSGGVR